MASNYTRGRGKEYKVADILKGFGFMCQRSASSKGLFDVVAYKDGEVKLVQVKYTKAKKYYEDLNCKKARELIVPKGVSKELWVFYFGKEGYDIVELAN